MDNDYKVIIQKPEVELFLQDDVYAFNREKPQVYDLEKEFEKVKAQKKHTILWPLIILFIISALLTFGITRYIAYQNRQISVNVDVFEDINLRKLLDMVSRLEEQVKQAKNSKARAENRMQTELETALAEKDAEIFTVQALPISAKEKNKKIFRWNVKRYEFNRKTIEDFDVIFVGFPIWWYVAPTIVNAFLEKHDFSGKQIILFATSGGSDFGKTVESLKDSAPGADIREGMLQRGRQDMTAWKSWAASL